MDEIDQKFKRTAEMLLDVNATLLALCTELALKRIINTDDLDRETKIVRDQMRDISGV